MKTSERHQARAAAEARDNERKKARDLKKGNVNSKNSKAKKNGK